VFLAIDGGMLFFALGLIGGTSVIRVEPGESSAGTYGFGPATRMR